MRIASWNIGHPGRLNVLEEVARVVASLECDVLAIQEVAPSAVTILSELLAAIGLKHAVEHPHDGGWWLMTVAREPLVELPHTYTRIPTSEQAYPRTPPIAGEGEVARILSTQVPSRGLVVHNVHVPPGSKTGWRKVDTLRALHGAVQTHHGSPQVACGDLNEPLSEEPDGSITSWALRNESARANPTTWDAAVQGILRGELVHDCFRSVHGEAVCALWSHRRAKVNRRYDHVLASRSLRPISAHYIEAECSDHKAAVVELVDA